MAITTIITFGTFYPDFKNIKFKEIVNYDLRIKTSNAFKLFIRTKKIIKK